MRDTVIFDFGGVVTSSPFEAVNRPERERGLPPHMTRPTHPTRYATPVPTHQQKKGPPSSAPPCFTTIRRRCASSLLAVISHSKGGGTTNSGGGSTMVGKFQLSSRVPVAHEGAGGDCADVQFPPSSCCMLLID